MLTLKNTLFNMINNTYLYNGHSEQNRMEVMGLITNIKILQDNLLFCI